MSRRTGWLIAAVILIGSIALAALMVSSMPEPERRPPPSQVPFAITAPVAAGEGAIPVYGAGTVRPHAEIDIAAEVSGRVGWVAPAFQSGGRVREGQPLFRVEGVDYRNKVEQARAGIAVQQLELLKVQEEANVARAQYGQFKQRQADQGSASDASPLALWQPQIAAAEAKLARAGVALAEAELNLSRTEVKAPFSGVVRTESVDVGQLVAAGQGVGRLYASDAVEVVVPLSDTGAALLPSLWDLRAGDDSRRIAARVTAEYGASTYSWEGYVDRAEASLDEQTRTIEVIVRVPRPFAAGAPAEANPGGEEAEAAGAQARQRGVGGPGRQGDDRYGTRPPALRRHGVRDRRPRGGSGRRHRRHHVRHGGHGRAD